MDVAPLPQREQICADPVVVRRPRDGFEGAGRKALQTRLKLKQPRRRAGEQLKTLRIEEIRPDLEVKTDPLRDGAVGPPGDQKSPDLLGPLPVGIEGPVDELDGPAAGAGQPHRPLQRLPERELPQPILPPGQTEGAVERAAPAALEIGDPSLQCLKIGGGIGVIQLGHRWGRRILYQPVRCPADKPRHLFRPSRAGQCVEQPREGDLALPGEQIVEFRVLRREVPTVKARLRPPGHQQNLRQPATQQRQQPAQIGGVPDIAAQADKIRPAGTEPVGHLFGGLIDVGVLHPQGMRQCATGACRRGERPGCEGGVDVLAVDLAEYDPQSGPALPAHRVTVSPGRSTVLPGAENLAAISSSNSAPGFIWIGTLWAAPISAAAREASSGPML